MTERQLNHRQAQRLYLWRGPTQLRGLPLSPNSQAAGRAGGSGYPLRRGEDRPVTVMRATPACETFKPSIRRVISGQGVGPEPRAPGRRNFVTFVSRDTWSEVDLASCHRPSVWDCAPILRAALVQGSSSNLPNGRRHFGQPRTCSQGGTAGERAARLLGSRSPPTPCVPFAEEFQPYTKSKKQYRTMGSHPLHSYLATNRILQLIYDITCI